MAKRVEIKRWSDFATWARHSTSLNANQVTLIKSLVKIGRDLEITVREIDASFGITDDPTDEDIRFMVAAIDLIRLPFTLGSGPLRTDFIQTALWVNSEVWRSIGTDSGPVSVDEEAENITMKTKFKDGNQGDTENQWVCALVFSSTTSTIYFYGKMQYDVVYRQIVYNNDGSEFGQNPAALGGA